MSFYKKKYLWIVVNLALSSASFLTHANSINFVVMGDPQAWRLTTGNPNGESNKSPWENHNNEVVKSLNQLKKEEDVKFGIINGDITEFGRQSPWESYKHIYDENLTFPVYIGLGNHDYANNVNNCTGWGFPASYNSCALHMAVQLQYSVNQYKRNNPSANFNIDKSGEQYGQGSGSLAYSWDDGDFHFIQLNNYPTYNVHLDQWDGAWDLRITKSLDWLEKDLSAAASRGQRIIINLHDANDHFVDNSTSDEKQRFRNMLQKYNVIAVFAAHNHNAYEDKNRKDIYGNVPVFISDALFKGGYYLVKADENGMTIDKYRGESGTPKYDGTMKHIEFMGKNILINGDFNEGFNSWKIHNDQGRISFAIKDDGGSRAAYIGGHYEKPYWGTIGQNDIAVESGKKYEVSFKARGEGDRVIMHSYVKADSDDGYKKLGEINLKNITQYTDGKFTITTGPKAKKISLTMENINDDSSGYNQGVYIKNITIKEIK